VTKRKELVLVVNNNDEIGKGLQWARHWMLAGLPAGAVQLIICRPRRTIDQNKKLWPMLNDVAKQVQMHINGWPVWASKEDWKDVFTASLQQEARMAMGLDGRMVMLGLSTRSLSKKKFCDLVELIYAFGAEKGVRWSEPPKAAEELWRAAA